MSIKDHIVQALALRWIRGKVDAARKAGSSMLKFLDGNKNRLTNLVYLVVSLIALASGADYHQIANAVLQAMNWPQDAGAAASMAIVASQLWTAWALIDSIRKARKQRQAGATLAELNSPAGVVKAAIADGTLPAVVKAAITDGTQPVLVKGMTLSGVETPLVPAAAAVTLTVADATKPGPNVVIKATKG